MAKVPVRFHEALSSALQLQVEPNRRASLLSSSISFQAYLVRIAKRKRGSVTTRPFAFGYLQLHQFTSRRARLYIPLAARVLLRYRTGGRRRTSTRHVEAGQRKNVDPSAPLSPQTMDRLRGPKSPDGRRPVHGDPDTRSAQDDKSLGYEVLHVGQVTDFPQINRVSTGFGWSASNGRRLESNLAMAEFTHLHLAYGIFAAGWGLRCAQAR